jgi:hypothetical protein
MTSHSIVDDVVARYLAMVDSELPGRIEGLYLEGSVALGDFHPHTSDIDFVAVTKGRLDPAEIATLERIHARLREQRRRPFFDGGYVTWEDLAGDPAQAGPGPHVHEGRLRAANRGGHSPVTWHTVARHGVPYRGPAPSEIDIRTDPAHLAAWTEGNLDAYWGRLLDGVSRVRSPWGLAALTPYGVVWIVTGVSRLHYTLATGDITSKGGAGRHALATFPGRWHRIVREALRIRRADQARSGVSGAVGAVLRENLVRQGENRSLYPTPLSRRRDVLAFGRMVIADAHRLYVVRSVSSRFI